MNARSELMAKQPRLKSASISRNLRKMWAKVSPAKKNSLRRVATLANSKVKKNSTPLCEMVAPIETVWLPDNY